MRGKMDKSNLYLTEEDIEAIKTIGFDIDVAKKVRETLNAHHEKIFRLQTGSFLVKQYQKLLAATDKDEKVKLLWEIVEWKQNYKSLYSKQ